MKQISVEKDGTGRVIKVTETEGIVQPGGLGYPVKFEHLNGVQPKYEASTNAPLPVGRRN